ncbi:Gastric triacylglycerol lipase-like 2 [Homarus americanus]|uniref:Lipase n=1 Tax=Homarus americanus TaxID=6706 RepID=A0A8J5N5X9_HOMAM|nr:Gastric triacylglycerol lipase-like 2 [Homarus americanus]
MKDWTTSLLVFVVVLAVSESRYSNTTTPVNFTSSSTTSSTEHPHTHLNTAQLIQARGYPAEVHRVITPDGYILEMHRIPHGRTAHHAHTVRPNHPPRPHQPARPRGRQAGRSTDGTGSTTSSSTSRNSTRDSKGRRVVFILHGFLSSSADFVMNDPDEALGFMMADAGYDVWLGNNRGNYYGRQHVTLSPEKPEFWDYSWNEMARYDVPTMLSYVRKSSGMEQVYYIGHSMGTSLFFAMMHYHPHINSWVRAMAALAPAGYVYHKYSMAHVLAPFFDGVERELRRRGIMEIFQLTKDNSNKASKMCGPNAITSFMCILMYFISGGPNSNYVDKDVRKTAKELPWVALDYRIQLRDFNHVDFWRRTRVTFCTTLS